MYLLEVSQNDDVHIALTMPLGMVLIIGNWDNVVANCGGTEWGCVGVNDIYRLAIASLLTVSITMLYICDAYYSFNYMKLVQIHFETVVKKKKYLHSKKIVIIVRIYTFFVIF